MNKPLYTTLAAACALSLAALAAVFIYFSPRKASRPLPEVETGEDVVDLSGWDPDIVMRFISESIEPPYTGLTPQQIRAVEMVRAGKRVRLLNMPKAGDERLRETATKVGPDGYSPAGRALAQMPPEERKNVVARMETLGKEIPKTRNGG